MKQVIAHIHGKAAELYRNPFIEWLNDSGIESRERLSAWLPSAAFFVFGFMDLNAEIFRYPALEADADPLKQAINDHAVEDSTHWPWYLADLGKLGLDPTMRFSEALQLLWSPETRTQRLAAYEFCVLASRATDPTLRYAMLTALEAYAHVLFGTVVRVSETFETETGIRLSYLGKTHSEREPGHLVNQTGDAEDLFESRVLEDDDRALAIGLADSVWHLIDSRWREFHQIASQREVAVGVA